MVAIKILSKKTLRKVPGGEATIEREIAIIESLNHKHVVSIFSHFPVEAKQKFYIVFEYMGGGTLTSLLDSAPEKRLPLHQARKLFLHLISGLEHLRERRILHRDIKPDNLLLTSSGELKIGDFGVADVISSDPSDKIRDNTGIGSPAFQAPELISSPSASPSSSKKPKRSTIDLIFKSDIWSAGIVLYVHICENWELKNGETEKKNRETGKIETNQQNWIVSLFFWIVKESSLLKHLSLFF